MSRVGRSPIRPLEREDLPQVISLYDLVMGSGFGDPPQTMTRYFERTMLDHPWADPEIPALVYEDAGRIVGFMGSHVRHMSLDGKPIRLACAGQLVAEPGARHSAAGTFLLRHYLRGPQDVTITDGATDTVRQMWTGLGGHVTGLSCLEWTRVYRPWRFAGDLLMKRAQTEGMNPLARLAWELLDAVTSRLAARLLSVGEPSVVAEPLTPELVLEHMPELTSDLRLRPAYDPPFLEWLFTELEEVKGRGTLIKSLVRDANGRVLGWYVYYLLRRGISEVIAFVARDRHGGEVLDHLLRNALIGGASALQGRMEPHLLEPLFGRRCFFRYSEWALIHSREPAIISVATSPQALLTRMEGEWWMGHHLLGVPPGRSFRPPSAGTPRHGSAHA